MIDRLLPPSRRRVVRRTVLRSAAGAFPGYVVARLRGRRPTSGLAVGAVLGAVAVETPTALGAVAPVVAGARWRSRGVPSVDEAVDLATGAAGSLLTLSVFPRVVAAPARGISVSDPRHVTPSEEGAGLILVANHASGSGTGGDVARAVAERLPKAEVRSIEPGDDVDEILSTAASQARSLGIVGGDGSVNGAARIALDAGVPLAVFPGGTLNHFARDLGVDSVDRAVEAVRSGDVVAIDVGTIADRPFVNNASIGSYAALVDERERLEERLGKWPAMIVALVRVLHRGRRFDVLVDGERRRVWMIFFGNCAFEPAGFAPADRSDLVDGMLDVRFVDASSPWSRTRLIASVLLGTLGRSRVYERRMVPRIHIECEDDEGPVRLAADGETFDGPASFEVAKHPASLLVHAAHADEGGSGVRG